MRTQSKPLEYIQYNPNPVDIFFSTIFWCWCWLTVSMHPLPSSTPQTAAGILPNYLVAQIGGDVYTRVNNCKVYSMYIWMHEPVLKWRKTWWGRVFLFFVLFLCFLLLFWFVLYFLSNFFSFFLFDFVLLL